MSLPEYYGDPPYQMTAEEKAAYKKYLDQFVIAATAIKKEWPHAKCLMPWGIPTFPILSGWEGVESHSPSCELLRSSQKSVGNLSDGDQLPTPSRRRAAAC